MTFEEFSLKLVQDCQRKKDWIVETTIRLFIRLNQFLNK